MQTSDFRCAICAWTGPGVVSRSLRSLGVALFMHLVKRVSQVVSVSCAAIALLAGGLAGCSGGGSTPQTATQVAPPVSGPALSIDETQIASLSVNRSAAAAIGARVTRASAYASPIEGRQPQSLGLRQTESTSPNDLSFYGGPTVGSTQSINIYVNCGNSCWGSSSPAVFERNLGASTMIHLIDQYTGSTASGRYTFGGSLTENYDTSTTLQDQDIYNLVHTAAASYGTGYGKIYHVFLQQGVSQCSQSAGGCYAQQYCAYHGNVDFSHIGHALYSVEPYQGINGCQASSLTNSTASTLSHETFETITDPDVPQNVAWYNNTLGEIGDICASNRGYVTLNGTQYYIQTEYSNRSHACRFST